MPKYYCDYCDVYLTHDSSSVRKAHNNGKNHIMNVRNYYAELGQDKAQAIIDEITKAYERAGQSDYCDVYLTHDSSSVRKAHNNGKNHIMNVRNYYAELGQDKAQAIIDEITKAYERAGQSGFPPQYGYAPGVPPVSPAAAPVAATPYGGPVVPPIMMGRTAGNIPPGTVPGPAPGIGAPPPGLGGPAPGTIPPPIPPNSSSQPATRPPTTGPTPQPFGGPPPNNNFIRPGQTPGFQASQGTVSQPQPGPFPLSPSGNATGPPPAGSVYGPPGGMSQFPPSQYSPTSSPGSSQPPSRGVKRQIEE
ncbi:hypothetical protein Glove_166g284 [Diversispora epigaea]|uniref:U1 small nuclear ribonucleoprotein C n=1 Tax=Diversispora epigaea TaxID=1348612 RepID=A0A397IQN8_9GLOM|nr:hypothetical protein Glove_166g284 [Diversispora epigaea]